MRDKALDDQIADPRTYADDRAYHALFTRLRREDPVHWTEPDGYRPFWTVSRHADVIEVERQSRRFLNDPRLALIPAEVEAQILARTGRHYTVRSLVNMDDPDHRVFREVAQAWFMPRNLRRLEAELTRLAAEAVERMAALGGACDFVRDVATWYPLRVIMTILGVPQEDEPAMLKLTQELFAPADPERGRGVSAETRMATTKEFFAYFTSMIADRRRRPRDDVASVIANAEVNGSPIGELEAASYYIIIATAGHDTTTATTAGGLLALLKHPGELARLRADRSLLATAIDEMLRWVTPVKHFFRTAAEGAELGGRRIRAGDSLMLCYPSANRDEDVFEDPFAFRVDRAPNRHLAFGYGPHLCLGEHLAKLEIRTFYETLLDRVAEIELAGEAASVASTFVGGLKRLPVRYRVQAVPRVGHGVRRNEGRTPASP